MLYYTNPTLQSSNQFTPKSTFWGEWQEPSNHSPEGGAL